ncbi:MAG: hypothetical protein JNL78_10580 [Rhodocyclaceae bacterium]|jgi:hypothetical protein|nr:hypothetical protein [Rhodocyclaceae bacterium]
MAEMNKGLKELVEFFAEFERHRHELTGTHFLDNALSAATEMLLDDSSLQMHEQVRRLVAMWFERVSNWFVAALQRTPRDYEYVRVHHQNVQLFSDPLFQLPRDRFDDDGSWRAGLLFQFKPERIRTAAEQQYVNEWLMGMVNKWRAKGTPKQ